jgi:hypothetical protein
MVINMEDLDDKIIYEAAKKRVEKLKGFYVHLLVYLLVNTMIIYANYQFGNSKGSFFELGNFSTAFFWGIGLAAHGLSIFSLEVFFGKDWEERKIREIMDRERERNDYV